MNEPHTSVLNVEFCLYNMYVGLYITAGSAGHSYRMPLQPPCASIDLPHSVSCNEQVRMSNSDTTLE